MRKLDFNKPSVCGIGYIGTEVDPDEYPLIYGRWKAMINMGYNKTYKLYNGYLVNKEWHCFSIFAIWFIKQCELLGIDPKVKNYNYVLNCTAGSIRGHEVHSPANTRLMTKSEQQYATNNDVRFI
ncbi:hypothetical protein [Vibrio ouci]|uniref:Uncharacterized protein n=1 Tax=Vibrio ouci TaxID=2499078 RepID=A0A4Y8WET3_9VIBR|nr:hypothetical protein [Vibrio ouci]TFH91143.1 hypothetical protein ELS82_13565 [Vibrio ouci]